jgi:predicted ATP-grasp superfamily ATP-dependent carboligase
MATMRVLLIDEGRERCSVAVARALVDRGWTVDAGSVTPNLASRARAVSSWREVAHTSDGQDAFVDSVNAQVERHGYEFVIVAWEAAVCALSACRDRLNFPVGYGPHEGLLRAIDKEQLMALAAHAGIAVPSTSRATADTLEQMVMPVIVKPASPLEVSFAAMSFDDPQAAIAHAQQIEDAGGRAIVQEQLRGDLIAVSLVAGESGIVSIAQQRAIHVWPTAAGVTARGVTVPVDPVLRAKIEGLLEELQWQGLAQLQFLVSEDGEPRLLDFNPRLYGSIAMAIRAGANHPDVWARLVTGRAVSPQVGRPGATFQWFTRDLRASLASPDKLSETGRCLYTAATASHNLWSWREPALAPRFLYEQGDRAVRERFTHGTSEPIDDASRSARLNGLPPEPRVTRALRTRRIPTKPERIAQRLLMKTDRLTYEDSWLAPLQAARADALGQENGGPRFLVRVDEFPYYSGYDNPKVGLEASRRFHAVMAEERVPHLMSVVPQWTHDALNPDGSGGRPLDDADQELLAQMRQDGVTFAQHGNTHRTRAADPRHQSEMCGLSAPELDALLEDGRIKLAEVGISPRILVPPFNRFDADQWPVLSRRYDIVTGGPESVVLMGFHGGPQWRGSAVYLPCYAPLYETAANVLPAAEAIIERNFGGWIPIVLHLGWEVDDDYTALRTLARRIAPHAASWTELLASVDASRGS